MSILIVDDSELAKSNIKKLLTAGGYSDLLFAESVREAINLLSQNTLKNSGRNVDILLMDIEMPELDGINGTRLIRANKNFQEIPIIMVTAKDSPQDLRRGFEAGAIDYITKPFNEVELLARVENILRLKHEIDRRRAREEELFIVNQKLQEVNQKLERLSMQDGLTGIPNRRYFDDFYAREWKSSLRYSSPLAVIMMDVDYFKLFNDNYGHQTGDDCLIKVARTLSQATRRPDDLIARYGGEEFVAVLSGIDKNGALFVAESVRSLIAELAIPHKASQISDIVTLSLGLAVTVPEPASDPETLIKAADQALYQAKKDGRNRIRVYEGPFE